MKIINTDWAVRLASIGWTVFGLIVIIYYGDFTNGLLMLILGELIDQPKMK